MIPFIFEIPEEYIVRQVQLIIVILLSLVDMLLYLKLISNKKQMKKNFKNKIARTHILISMNWNERKETILLINLIKIIL